MTIPEFTATKGPKSATFRVKNIDHRIDGDFDRIILYPELKTPDPFGTDTAWNGDRSTWPDKVRAAVREYDAAAQAAAVTALGSALDGKTELERTIMVAVKCFDNANGTTSTIDWGD